MTRDPLRSEAYEKERKRYKKEKWKRLGVRGQCLVICSQIRLWKLRLFLWACRVGTMPTWNEVVAYEEKKAFDEGVAQMEQQDAVYFREYMMQVLQKATKTEGV